MKTKLWESSIRAIAMAAALLGIMPAIASAQVVSDDLTCQQAVRAYEQNGRIYKRVGRQAIPIYNGVPASQRSTMRCSPIAVFVNTRDNPRCAVAYRCSPRSFGGGP